ncbi:MAG: biotin/lipoyl-binding protein, partial [Cytophagales bacterium]|nr:biotin/lipoyl-binding protein [Cytophagales bacterium]
MKKNTSLVLIPFLGLVLFTACSSHKKEAPAVQENTVVSVKTSIVQKENTQLPVVASGLVASSTEARLSFKTGGIIDKIYVEEGDYVKKGQLLATLKLNEIKAQVAQAEEALQKADRDLKRVTNLYKDSVASLEQLQNVTT